MVRALAIRQSFLALEIMLAIFITAALGMLLSQWHRAQLPPLVPGPGLNASTASGGSPTGKIGERYVYNGIVENGLFGPAGRTEVPSDAQGHVVSGENEPPETGLELKLWAVTSLSPTSPFGTASIENRAGRSGSRLFHINDEVLENVTLEEIHPRWVVLLNRQEADPKVERLSLDEEKALDPTDRVALTGALPAQRIELDASAFVEALTAAYPDLLSTLKPELYRDADGNVAGITAAGLAAVPLAKQMGLEDGDILQTVNNERISSEQKLLDIVQKHQGGSDFSIGILRDGRRMSITYRLR